MTAVTIVPDTNIWRYIVDADALEQIRKTANRCGVSLVACPAVVYECLRLLDSDLRCRLARALTQNDWYRPMPEAYVEAEAVRTEIGRLHPEWLVPRPDLENFYRNRADWRGAFWRRVRRDPKRMAAIITDLQSHSLEQARQESRSARNEAIRLRQNVHSLQLNSARAVFMERVPGWDGSPFETWRAVSQAHWWDAVALERNQTAMDWLGPWLDLPRLRSERDVWIRMWTREVQSQHLPREWIRWAMTEVQALRKVTPGTPVDNQIATYLVDFDLFFTSDRVFGECIQTLRPHSPSPLASVSTAPGGPAAVDFLLEVMEEPASAPQS